MPVTAKDIARELNLSQPTVSRILSGDPMHRAADDTRQRVYEAARRLGYQPNAVARSLRQGRTNIIGLHTSHEYDARNDFYGTLIGSLQCACRERHLDLLLPSALHGSSVEDMYGKLRDGRVDGLILHTRLNDPLVRILSQSSLPVVAVADPLIDLPAVTCDDADGMRQLVEHLWQRGYRRFVMLLPQVALASVERRRYVFEVELQRRGLLPRAWRVLPIDFERVASALDDLMQGEPPTVVCCWNDRTAYNLLRACEAREVNIPNQLAVAGFDGLRDDKLPRRQLLTVDCHWEDVAACALGVLVQLLENRASGGQNTPPPEICLPVTLLPGDTA